MMKQKNQMTRELCHSAIRDELYHHGILGMRWGIRRFQPYPKGHEKDGKFVGEQQNNASKKTVSKGDKKVTVEQGGRKVTVENGDKKVTVKKGMTNLRRVAKAVGRAELGRRKLAMYNLARSVRNTNYNGDLYKFYGDRLILDKAMHELGNLRWYNAMHPISSRVPEFAELAARYGSALR